MALIKRLNQLSVGWKIGLPFILLCIIVLVNGFLILFITNLSASDASVINVAGRQRMLSQRMTKEALIIAAPNSTIEDVNNLKVTRALFEVSHDALRYGNQSMGIPATTNSKAISQWVTVDTIWQDFRSDIIAIEDSEGAPLQEDIEDVIEDSVPILVELNLLVSIFEEDASARNTLTLWTSLISPIFVPIISIVSVFLLNRNLSRPITQVAQLSNAIASGDLTADIVATVRRDEIGILLTSFATMVERLSGIIRISQEISSNVASSSEELASTTEEVNALSEEIAATIQQISRGASNQSELSTKALEDINKMSEVVDSSLRDIEGTLQVIEDIAGQTNILALNAAIEAARAGEYGRGFAVVADNVRRLAEETKTNSADISRVTAEIVTNIGGSVTVLQETLQGFAAQSEEFSASSEEVAAATEEQTAALHQLTSSTQELSQMGSELANIVKQFKLSAASQK